MCNSVYNKTFFFLGCACVLQVQLLAVSKVAVADLGNDWLIIYQGPALSTNWSSLRAGCKYQLRVAACNSVGSSSFSIPLGFVTAPDAPLPPPRPIALLESRVSSQGGGQQPQLLDSQSMTAWLACSCHVLALSEARSVLSDHAQSIGRGQLCAAGML